MALAHHPKRSRPIPARTPSRSQAPRRPTPSAPQLLGVPSLALSDGAGPTLTLGMNPRLLLQPSVSSVLYIRASNWETLSPAQGLALLPRCKQCLWALRTGLLVRENCVPPLRSATSLGVQPPKKSEVDAQPQRIPQICSRNAPLRWDPRVSRVNLGRFAGGHDMRRARKGPKPRGRGPSAGL